ncbi:MAG: hypothetical protein IK100_08530, partial [Muribaculaceae bacterium]|nr:hypothetical protein [Muribaculaceae bacterium]
EPGPREPKSDAKLQPFFGTAKLFHEKNGKNTGFNILSQKNGRSGAVLGGSRAARDPQEGASGGAKARRTAATEAHSRPRAGEACRPHIII